MPIIRFLAVGIGKTLSKAFGLATMAFFGRIPTRDDDRIALVGIASLTWLVVLAAAIWPALAEVVIPFAPDDEGSNRLIAVVLTVAIPPAIGAVVASMHNNRPRHAVRTAGHVLSGYVYAALIGLTVTVIVVVVPVIKFGHLIRRFTVQRIMIMIPAGRYDRVLAHLRDVLEGAGVGVSVGRENPVVVVLFRWLGWVLGRVFDREVAKEMGVLHGHTDGGWFEVVVHAADISVIGRSPVARHVRALVADGLDERVVCLTWDEDGQHLEDRIRAARRALDAGDAPDREELADLVSTLARLQLDQEAWDALRRIIYRLERDTARATTGREIAPEGQRRAAPHQ